MLHLPDVAELVRDQAFVHVGTAKEDHEVRGEAVEAAQRSQLEKPGCHDDPDMPDADAPRPPVEPIEALLRSDEPRICTSGRDCGRPCGQRQAIGSRTRTAERSCACVYWNW